MDWPNKKEEEKVNSFRKAHKSHGEWSREAAQLASEKRVAVFQFAVTNNTNPCLNNDDQQQRPEQRGESERECPTARVPETHVAVIKQFSQQH